MTTSQHVDELYQQGFTVLPAYFSADDCQAQRDIMDDYWRSKGSPPLEENAFGFNIHPMMPSVPRMAPYLAMPEAIEILSQALRDDARLVHLGARVSGPQSAQRIGWHQHYGGGDWDAATIPQRDRLERILTACYPDGTTSESGNLVALPRKYNDPLGDHPGEGEQAGEQKVNAPPGSVVIFDTALWHDAQRGTGSGIRRLWGTHFQGWSDTRAHGEDNEIDAKEIAQYKNEIPLLKAIIER